jgi:hypothetical protein
LRRGLADLLDGVVARQLERLIHPTKNRPPNTTSNDRQKHKSKSLATIQSSGVWQQKERKCGARWWSPRTKTRTSKRIDSFLHRDKLISSCSLPCTRTRPRRPRTWFPMLLWYVFNYTSWPNANRVRTGRPESALPTGAYALRPPAGHPHHTSPCGASRPAPSCWRLPICAHAGYPDAHTHFRWHARRSPLPASAQSQSQPPRTRPWRAAPARRKPNLNPD